MPSWPNTSNLWGHTANSKHDHMRERRLSSCTDASCLVRVFCCVPEIHNRRRTLAAACRRAPEVEQKTSSLPSERKKSSSSMVSRMCRVSLASQKNHRESQMPLVVVQMHPHRQTTSSHVDHRQPLICRPLRRIARTGSSNH